MKIIIDQSLASGIFFVTIRGAAKNPLFEYEVCSADTYREARNIALIVQRTMDILKKESEIRVTKGSENASRSYHDLMAFAYFEVLE